MLQAWCDGQAGGGKRGRQDGKGGGKEGKSKHIFLSGTVTQAMESHAMSMLQLGTWVTPREKKIKQKNARNVGPQRSGDLPRDRFFVKGRFLTVPRLGEARI